MMRRLDRWVTRRAQLMLLGMAVVGLLALACWVPLFRPFDRRAPLPSQQELSALVRTVPRGSTEAEVLAFLRAQGFQDSDIRIITHSPFGGNSIVAQSGPRRPFALHLRYLKPTFKFDEQGRLVEAGVGSTNNSLAELETSFPPGGRVVYLTPPPAR